MPAEEETASGPDVRSRVAQTPMETLEAAGWHCARCPRPAEEVHHLTYERLGGDVGTAGT